VWLGELDLSSTSDCTTYNYERVCAPPVEEFTIDKWILHEEFNLFYPGYDIALIKLNKKVVFKGKNSLYANKYEIYSVDDMLL